jgi:hypothetical protein
MSALVIRRPVGGLSEPRLLPDSVHAQPPSGRFHVRSGPHTGAFDNQIFEEKLCLARLPAISFAALPSIRGEQLAGEPLIAAPPDVALTLRDADLRFFRSGGVTPTIRLEAQLQ